MKRPEELNTLHYPTCFVEQSLRQPDLPQAPTCCSAQRASVTRMVSTPRATVATNWAAGSRVHGGSIGLFFIVISFLWFSWQEHYMHPATDPVYGAGICAEGCNNVSCQEERSGSLGRR